eukprot:TRINITY_DN7576_c0_g1_i2.p1 TRINITY_DN7576_c0_g1~~TRINITY_DN7576_c0_g1_i2.p1  ORF type:complete len:833 (+),score=124.95 TRINITY_DN7576_c0_g1_i2:47-2545(+)
MSVKFETGCNDDIYFEILKTSKEGAKENGFGSPLHLLPSNRDCVESVKCKPSSISSLGAAFIEFQQRGPKDGVLTNSNKMRSENFDSNISELLGETLHVPKALDFMCKYILSNGPDIDNLFGRTEDVESKRVDEVLSKFSEGKFYDCGSVVVVANIFKKFLQSLPEPLVPHSFYLRATNIVSDYLDHCTNILMNYKEIESLCSDLKGEDLWAPLWDESNYKQPEDRKWLAIAGVINEFAFNKWREDILSEAVNEIENWLSQMTVINRHTLLYLGVFILEFSRFSSTSTSLSTSSSSLSSLSPDTEHLHLHLHHNHQEKYVYESPFSSSTSLNPVESIVQIFSEYVLKPAFISSEIEEKRRDKFLKNKFFLIFLYKIENEIHLKTLRKSESSSKDNVDDLVNSLLQKYMLSSYQSRDKVSYYYSPLRTNKKPTTNINPLKTSLNLKKVSLDQCDKISKSLPDCTRKKNHLILDDVKNNSSSEPSTNLSDDLRLPSLQHYSMDFFHSKASPRAHSPRSTHQEFSSKQPKSSKPIQHFTLEWECEKNQFVDTHGTIMFKDSTFLRQSPHFNDWLSETPHQLKPQFCSKKLDDNIIDTFFENSFYTEGDNDLVAPGKGLLGMKASSTENLKIKNSNECGLLFHEAPKPKSVDMCEICSKNFRLITCHRHPCNYCGKVLCAECCSGKYFVPHKIVNDGDFEQHSVCLECQTELNSSLSKPMIKLKSLSKNALNQIGKEKCKKLNHLQSSLAHYIYDIILPNCPARFFLLALIPPDYVHLLLDNDDIRVSILDLYSLKTSHYLPHLENIYQIYIKHLKVCDYCGPKHHSSQSDYHLTA